MSRSPSNSFCAGTISIDSISGLNGPWPDPPGFTRLRGRPAGRERKGGREEGLASEAKAVNNRKRKAADSAEILDGRLEPDHRSRGEGESWKR